MFNDINSAQILGNVTNDPDLRFTPSGQAVLNFGVATNRRYKKGEEWVEDTTFHNVVVWGNQAQGLAQRMRKGTRIFIVGRLQTRSWDGTDGKKQYKTEIVADTISLLSRYNEGKLNGDAPVSSSSRGGNEGDESMGMPDESGPAAKEPQAEVMDESTINPDDLPF